MTLHEQTLDSVLTAVGERSPTPGGGAVAAITAALAAALGRMVVNYSLGKKSLAAHDELHREALRMLADGEARALEMADADAAAYGRMQTLGSLPEDDERRRREYPEAVRQAIAVPNRVLDESLRVLQLLERLLGRTNRFLFSDLAIAALLAQSAAEAAAWNVRVNLAALEDRGEADRMESDLEQRLERARTARARIEAEGRSD